MLVCYIKRRKSFFYDLFSRSITWGYREIQGLTRGYMGIQGNTGGYKGLQRVRRGYRGLQGVTGGYKGYMGLQRITETFFQATTSLGTLSWFILHKNQS